MYRGPSVPADRDSVRGDDFNENCCLKNLLNIKTFSNVISDEIDH